MSEPLAAEAEGSFDPKLTGADTPRAEWRRSVGRYRESAEVYQRLMDLYFSPQFREAHGGMLAERGATIDNARAAQERGRRALAGEPEPIPPKDRTWAFVFAGASLLLLALGNLHLLLSMRIGASDPHVLRVGLKSYRLDPITTRHERFLLAGTTSAEINLSNAPGMQRLYETFDGREGHRVTVVMVSLKEGSRYLRFYDWTRNAIVEHQATWGVLEELTQLRHWTVVPAAALGAAVGAMTGAFGFLRRRGSLRSRRPCSRPWRGT